MARPILFSGAMVRAILAGRKTQTRRLLRWPLLGKSDGAKRRVYAERDLAKEWDRDAILALSPFGRVGTKLWVRETWAVGRGYDELSPSDLPPGGSVKIKLHNLADGPKPDWAGKTRVSIHMPRWASRLTLEVTEVRIEHVNAISTEDARAEGFSSDPIAGKLNGKPAMLCFFDPLQWFAATWDGINGDRAPWKSSPWVWIVGFKVVQP